MLFVGLSVLLVLAMLVFLAFLFSGGSRPGVGTRHPAPPGASPNDTPPPLGGDATLTR